MKSDRTALALGATEGIGGETALALSRHGWKSAHSPGLAEKPSNRR